MSDVTPELRAVVVQRASNRCEYCGLSQLGQEAAFHVDHVVPRAAGGSTVEGNLALACVSCSLRKWAKQSAADPQTGDDTPLFNPRTQVWSEHFRWDGDLVVALTATGRATMEALAMNRPMIVAIRQEESLRGRHPPEPGKFRELD
jgi:HNH endonuclease